MQRILSSGYYVSCKHTLELSVLCVGMQRILSSGYYVSCKHTLELSVLCVGMQRILSSGYYVSCKHTLEPSVLYVGIQRILSSGHGWKVASLNPCRSGGRIFFSKVHSVCWLLFGVCSTPVLPQWQVKDPGHSVKSAGGKLHLNRHTTWPNQVGMGWLCCRGIV